MVPAKKAYLDGELYGVGAAGLSSFAETRPRPTESAALVSGAEVGPEAAIGGYDDRGGIRRGGPRPHPASVSGR
jgi:hypothetical protein